MLVTQILRQRIGGSPVPFFPITATDQSSGKTLLATIASVLYGQVKLIWTGDDEETRKALTTIMASQEAVIAFDNIPEGTVIRSAVLAKLLTDRTWGDRMLGGNVLGKFANDRLWTATGNNLRIGGDMRTRSVLIGLDPAIWSQTGRLLAAPRPTSCRCASSRSGLGWQAGSASTMASAGSWPTHPTWRTPTTTLRTGPSSSPGG